MAAEETQAFKVVVVGDGNVGKTSLLLRFISKMFQGYYLPTIFDNYSSVVTYGGKEYHLNLCDTAGLLVLKVFKVQLM
jgi:Ras-related C3 botulinum toxin substrate 1